MIRAAMLGYWHVHAPIYAAQIAQDPRIELVAIWDEDAERGLRGAQEQGVEFVGDLRAVLERADVDAVVCQAPTTMHRDLLVRAAQAGKHIFSDKVLAPTYAEAREIVEAADRSGVVVYTGLPNAQHDYARTIRRIAASGELGSLVSVRVLNAHGRAISGELPSGFFDPGEAGGGALIDLCHALYLVPYFAGSPVTSVFCSTSYLSGRAVEDVATVLLRFASQTVGIVEATFASETAPFSCAVHGTTGSVMFRADIDPSGTGSPDGLLIRRDGLEPEFHRIPIDEPGPLPIEEWCSFLERGERPDANIELSLQLSLLVEAAYRSAETGASVAVTEERNPGIAA